MNINSKLTALILAVFGLVSLAGIIVLTVLHDPVPSILEFVTTGSLSAVAGITVPQVVRMPDGKVTSVPDAVAEANKIFPQA